MTVPNVTIGGQSLLLMDVGHANSLTVGGGSGTIANNGTVRLFAGPSVVPGTYSPVSAAAWTGNGTCQALGGSWNPTTGQFTASPIVTGTAGSPVNIDQSEQQRVLITDPATGNSVAASFWRRKTPPHSA